MEPTNHQHIRASLRDAVFTNLTVGMAESYFVAFMLALGVAEVVAGAGKILPMFIGVCLQMFAIRGPFLKLSLKSRMVGFIVVQGLTFPLLAALGYWHYSDTFLVIALLGLYWGAGLSSQPPWHRLMGETVPKRYRLKFFALRNAWAQIAVLVGLIGAGLFFGSIDKSKNLQGFVVLFCLCALLKFLSARELASHKSAPIHGGEEKRVRFRDFLKSMRHGPQGRLVGFLFLWYLVVQLSGPYFDPYMLSRLNWGLKEYTGIIAISFIGRVVAFRLLRARSNPRQIPWILLIGCAGITTTPFLWVLSQNYWWVFTIEFLSGCYWAAFELSVIMLYFERIKDEERTSIITYISFTNTLGMVIGVLLGGWLLQNWPQDQDKYLGLFTLSTLLRFLVLLTIPTVRVRDAWPVMVTHTRGFLTSAPFGALTKPLIEWNKKRKKKE